MKPKKIGDGPDWDKYVVEKKSYVTYMTGAKMYGLPYYTFVSIVKSAEANIRIRILRCKDAYRSSSKEMRR